MRKALAVLSAAATLALAPMGAANARPVPDDPDRPSLEEQIAGLHTKACVRMLPNLHISTWDDPVRAATVRCQ